jgi:hypothetical protein
VVEGVGGNDNLTHGDVVPGWYGRHPLPTLSSPYRKDRQHKIIWKEYRVEATGNIHAQCLDIMISRTPLGAATLLIRPHNLIYTPKFY